MQAESPNPYANRLDLSQFSERMSQLRAAIAHNVVGQSAAVDLLLTAILAGGHVLIEGVPGVAKTLLAKTLAHLLSAQFSRLQFTPDLMPSDVLGTTIFNPQTQSFELHRGPIFTQMLLVDEINRAPAKTQAALFEVMEERQATIDGTRYEMDDFYFILATQNPVEQEGTYRLPEAQMDRFLLRIDMPYPDADAELEVLRRYNAGQELRHFSQAPSQFTPAELMALRAFLPQVVADESILAYICRLVQTTRSSAWLYLGASPRAAVALLQCAKAQALLAGRDFLLPDDVKRIAPAVLSHRLSLTAEAEMNGLSAAAVVRALLDEVETPQ